MICALLAGVSASCEFDGAASIAHAFPVREYLLPSGLRVVIEQDDTSRMVGVVWVVEAGAVDDPPGKAGVAHMVEHMVMHAPGSTGVPTYRRLQDLGAVGINAVTDHERTTFHAFAPRRALDDLAALATARMSDPLQGAGESVLLKEQSVIAQEMRLRGGIASWAGSTLLMSALMPPGHPYARSLEEVQAAAPHISTGDAQGFSAQYYLPQRMTLVISGAIPAGWEARLWAMMSPSLYGDPQARRAPLRRSAATGDVTPNARADIQTHQVAVASRELWIAWRLPPAHGQAAVPLAMLGRVAQQVLSDRISHGDLPDVSAVATVTQTGVVASALLCQVTMRPSADVTRVKRQVTNAVADLPSLRIGLLSRPLERALRESILRTAFGMEGLPGRTLARAYLEHRDPGVPISAIVDAIQKVSLDDLADLAERYLTEGGARSVLLIPQEKSALAAADRPAGPGRMVNAASLEPGAPEGGAETDLGADLALDDAGAAPAGNVLEVAQAPSAAGASVTRLPSGLTVIALRRPDLPFVSMVLGFHAESIPRDPPGARFAVMFARHQQWSFDALDRGILETITRDNDSYREALSMFSVHAGRALTLLSDEAETLSVRGPNHEVERWMERAAAYEATPAGRAYGTFMSSLWGDHVYGQLPRAEVIRKVTRPEIKGWLERVRRPANGVLVVVGDIDQATFTRQIQRELDGWKGDPQPPPPPPAPPARPAPRVRAPVLFTADPPRATADVRFGCMLSPVRARRDAAADALLAEVLREDLFQRLRLQLGASYAPNAGFTFTRGGTAFLEGDIDLDNQAAPAGIDILRQWLDGAATRAVDPGALERARWRVARHSGMGHATNYQMARALFDTWNMDWPLDTLDAFPQELARVGAGDVAAALSACRASAVVSVVASTPEAAGELR